MAISREKKEKMVADYVDKMSRSQVLILADYRGLTVANMTELRQRLREQNGGFHVIKNSLFALALQESGVEVPPDRLDGPLAVGFSFGDSSPVAKALLDFARETQILQVRGAILGGQFLSADQVRAIADLPPREVVLAQLLGTVQGPMSTLVSTITAPLRELAQVLRARSEQGQEAAA
ncbi:MAG: 50S ribosomal protein L10 [Chloroflexi bacterium]|nr:MAG: 50S ribosomal protein L10 [Chloroflexota bacterium]